MAAVYSTGFQIAADAENQTSLKSKSASIGKQPHTDARPKQRRALGDISNRSLATNDGKGFAASSTVKKKSGLQIRPDSFSSFTPAKPLGRAPPAKPQLEVFSDSGSAALHNKLIVQEGPPVPDVELPAGRMWDDEDALPTDDSWLDSPWLRPHQPKLRPLYELHKHSWEHSEAARVKQAAADKLALERLVRDDMRALLQPAAHHFAFDFDDSFAESEGSGEAAEGGLEEQELPPAVDDVHIPELEDADSTDPEPAAPAPVDTCKPVVNNAA